MIQRTPWMVAVLILDAAWMYAGVADAGEPAAMGYRGDGTCVAAKSNPPVEWDGNTSKNIAWKTILPNWCFGCPVVAGNRVFVMSEPDRDHDFPVLLCLNAADGKILWQKEVQHAAAMPEAGRDAGVKAWHEHLDLLRKLYRSRYAWASATDKEVAKKVLADNGCEVDEKGGVSWKGDGTKRGNRVDVKLAGTFNRAGLWFDVWHLGGLGRIGYAYPTPVTDGKNVYVVTGNHLFSCYDMDGNLVWNQLYIGGGSSNAGYGGDDFCKNARSPLLYQNLLISDVGSCVRGIDKATGKLLWSDKRGGHEIVSPVLMEVNGKDLLMTYGPCAYTLPEGRKVPVEGWGNHGGTMLVKSDEPDVVFFTGGGEHGGWENKGNPPCSNPPPAAIKFTLVENSAGGTNAPSMKLVAKVLWSGMAGKSSGECHAGLVYYKGKLYHPGGTILDATTGKILAGEHRGRNRATPSTRHLMWVAGERLYGLNEGHPEGKKDAQSGGLAQVYDLNGKKLVENVIPVLAPEGERKDRIAEMVGGIQWGFSYGCPFSVAGDRLYIRSNDAIWCIGTK